METKQRILESTIELIAQKGYNSVTNRKVAKLAETNSASINYYFRSQELLLKQALKRGIEDALKPIEFYLNPTRINKNHNLGKAISKFYDHIKKDKLLISAVLIEPEADTALKNKIRKRYLSILKKIYQGTVVDSCSGSKRRNELIFYKIIALSLGILFSNNDLIIDFVKTLNQNHSLSDIDKRLSQLVKLHDQI